MFWLEMYDSEVLCFGEQNADVLLKKCEFQLLKVTWVISLFKN